MMDMAMMPMASEIVTVTGLLLYGNGGWWSCFSPHLILFLLCHLSLQQVQN